MGQLCGSESKRKRTKQQRQPQRGGDVQISGPQNVTIHVPRNRTDAHGSPYSASHTGYRPERLEGRPRPCLALHCAKGPPSQRHCRRRSRQHALPALPTHHARRRRVWVRRWQPVESPARRGHARRSAAYLRSGHRLTQHRDAALDARPHARRTHTDGTAAECPGLSRPRLDRAGCSTGVRVHCQNQPDPARRGVKPVPTTSRMLSLTSTNTFNPTATSRCQFPQSLVGRDIGATRLQRMF
ncbi:hypothetical protein N658DRAFT_15920 [Parathielavia hyrcaniae]|uniref:Uncharacterized protein n=1 Tax=Parathielavia hyrcaniae TaxID=113614 RepID=A0AAN6QF88_9PEZI|nr:hypothetical protein N658DRAFT_15920 [Parathielavia hyrcaniae]